MDSSPETFAETERRWSAMLSAAGFPSRVWWTFRDDFEWHRESRTLVVVKLGELENRSLTERLYASSDARILGAEITLLGANETVSFSSLFVPHSPIEAEALMIGGSKLRIPRDPVRIVVDRGFVKRGDGHPSPVDELHFSSDVQARLATG